jgi:hypothetical protein
MMAFVLVGLQYLIFLRGRMTACRDCLLSPYDTATMPMVLSWLSNCRSITRHMPYPDSASAIRLAAADFPSSISAWPNAWI